MFSSARLAHLGLLAVVVVFGTCLTILAYASYMHNGNSNVAKEVAQEAPLAQPAFLAMDTTEAKR